VKIALFQLEVTQCGILKILFINLVMVCQTVLVTRGGDIGKLQAKDPIYRLVMQEHGTRMHQLGVIKQAEHLR
jgi:hypothetical protein